MNMHCACCGMPAVMMVAGTSVCNNEGCRAQARDLARPAGPLVSQNHTPRASETKPANEPQGTAPGTLSMTEAGEIIVRSQVDGVTSLSLGIEPKEVLTFVRDNFPASWAEFVQETYNPGVDEGGVDEDGAYALSPTEQPPFVEG